MKHDLRPIYHRFTALGGPCSLQFEAATAKLGRTAAAEAEALLHQFERRYSRYRQDSVISQINRAAGSTETIELDEQAKAMMDYAMVAYQQSDGLFDITSGVLRRVWDFKSAVIPSQSAINELLPLVGLSHLEWNPPFVRLKKNGMEIDFGGFGKEFAADMLCEFLRNKGIQHGYVELAGDIAVIGPPSGASSWSIGISDPHAPSNAIASVPLGSGGLATSGTYQRSMTVNGTRYSHILNPKTGWPIETYASISLVSNSCLVAGSLSTIALLKGCPSGHEWLDTLAVQYLAIANTGALFGSIATTTKS